MASQPLALALTPMPKAASKAVGKSRQGLGTESPPLIKTEEKSSLNGTLAVSVFVCVCVCVCGKCWKKGKHEKCALCWNTLPVYSYTWTMGNTITCYHELSDLHIVLEGLQQLMHPGHNNRSSRKSSEPLSPKCCQRGQACDCLAVQNQGSAGLNVKPRNTRL